MKKLAYGCGKLALTVFVLLLAACGGGGGGGGGGSDLSSAPGLALSPTSLSFTAVQNGALPSTQNVQVTITNPAALGIIVGFPTGVTPPTWFDQNASFSCTPSITFCTLGAAVNTTSLPPGTYTTTLRFVIGDTPQHALALRDLPISYTITPPAIATIPSSLDFSFATGGTPPAAQPILLTGGTGSWTASADQPWISVPSSGSGALVNIGVNPAGLTPNTYNGTVTFSSGGHTAPVTVSLTVAAPGIQTSQASLSFSGVNGATIASKPLAITMNNGAALSWNAITPGPDAWLVLDRISGTQADTLNVSVNPANGSLASASGPFSSTITLNGSSGGSPFNKTVNVTLTLTKATLTPSPSTVTLGGTNGRDFNGVPVQLSLNTGANSFAWSYSGAQAAFAHAAPTSGSVSGTPVSVTLTPDATALAGGTHSGTAKFTALVNGDQVTANVPVTFNQESHKLLVDGNGVAFTKTPTLAKLTQTLKVRDNLGISTSWSAAKTQAWLTVTGTGTAGDDLVLTADPTALTPDTLYLDTVTITSSDASVENTETVQVGLWVGSADPDPITTNTGLTYTQVATDPVRPYAYIAVGADVHIINIHSGFTPPPIFNVAAAVGPMTVSHDGSTLYAVDTVNLKIVPVDLTTNPPTVGTPFSAAVASFVKVIDYTRTNGVGLILSGGGGQIFDAKTGALFPPVFTGPGAVAASRGGSRFCTVDVGQSSVDISCPSLDFTSLNGGQVLVGSTGTASVQGGNAADIAVSADGSVAYVASGTTNGVIAVRRYSTQDLSFLGGFTTAGLVNNVEVAADGRIFGASENVFTFGFPDVWVFDANGTQLTTRELAPGDSNNILARQMKVSGDGLRLIVLTLNFPATDPTLIFSTVAP